MDIYIGASITVHDWDTKSAQLKPVGIYEVTACVNVPENGCVSYI